MPIDVEIKCTYQPVAFERVTYCDTCRRHSSHEVQVGACLEVLYECKTCGRVSNDTFTVDKARFIYTMSDPRTGQVIYVGSTDSPVKRFRTHMTRAKEGTQTKPFFADLQDDGVLPVMTVIDVADRERSFLLEHKWMDHFRSLGQPLRNGTGTAPKFAFTVTHTPDAFTVAVNEDNDSPTQEPQS